MREYYKTLIIPGDNPATTFDKSILKLVILGNHEQAVKDADNLARFPPTSTDRYVVWFKNPTETEIKQYIPEFEDPQDDVVAFSLSTKNKIADYITKDEKLDYVRLDHSFTKAGSPEFN